MWSLSHSSHGSVIPHGHGLQQEPQEQAEAQPPLWTPHHTHRIPKGHDQSVMWLHLIQADHPGAAHSLQGQVCPQDHQE